MAELVDALGSGPSPCTWMEVRVLFWAPRRIIMNLYQFDLPDSLRVSGSVAVDTETMGLQFKRDRLCLVQLCTENGEVYLVQIHKDQHEAPNLVRILTDNNILKIFHFARFDVSALNYAFGIKVAPIYCTKIVSKLVRTYTDRHSLKALCREILGLDLNKEEQSSDWGNEKLSEDQLEYAAGDVLYLHKLKWHLDNVLQREGKSDLARKCFDQLQVISDLELAGYNPEELFQH